MDILSWNIQAGKGVDGRVDFARLRAVVDRFADALPGLICLQEVSRGYPAFAQDGEDDQLRLLTRYFPEYRLIYGPAIERWENGEPVCFGNVILCRLPLLECRRHALPMPLDTQARCCMPRQALEVVVVTSAGPLRIVTTHLEYYSPIQRRAQADYLVRCQREWRETANRHHGEDSGPFRRFVCPAATLLCGDFNAIEDDPAYRLLVDSEFVDAWRLVYGERPHAPTCGVHDREQWDQGPHCRDFFFISRQFGVFRIARLAVETATDASDHQPLLLRVAV